MTSAVDDAENEGKCGEDTNAAAEMNTADASEQRHRRAGPSKGGDCCGGAAPPADAKNRGEDVAPGGKDEDEEKDEEGEGQQPNETADMKRVRKWRKMLGITIADWKSYVRVKPQVVQRRVRKGIPDSLRGYAWQVMSGGRELRIRNPGIYDQLVFFEHSASDNDIIKDICRTFPHHVFYSRRHGPGPVSYTHLTLPTILLV